MPSVHLHVVEVNNRFFLKFLFKASYKFRVYKSSFVYTFRYSYKYDWFLTFGFTYINSMVLYVRFLNNIYTAWCIYNVEMIQFEQREKKIFAL